MSTPIDVDFTGKLYTNYDKSINYIKKKFL